MKHLKCAVVGDKDAGKTTLLISFTTNAYPGEYIPTVFENYSANVMVEGFPPVHLELWDTAPQEDYKKMRPMSYGQTDIFLCCFSLVRPHTLDVLQNFFLPEIHEYCPNAPFILVGTESDLRDEFEEHADEYKSKGMEPIPTSKGEEFARKNGASKYYEVSALKAINLIELFDDVARVALTYDKGNSKEAKQKSEGGCCEIF